MAGTLIGSCWYIALAHPTLVAGAAEGVSGMALRIATIAYVLFRVLAFAGSFLFVHTLMGLRRSDVAVESPLDVLSGYAAQTRSEQTRKRLVLSAIAGIGNLMAVQIALG